MLTRLTVKRNFVRLFAPSNFYKSHLNYKEIACPYSRNFQTLTTLNSLKPDHKENVLDKIIYNSKINRLSFIAKKKIEKQRNLVKKNKLSTPSPSFSLKYLTSSDTILKSDFHKSNDSNFSNETKTVEEASFPFSSDIINVNVPLKDDVPQSNDSIDWDAVNQEMKASMTNFPVAAMGKRWMNDYEMYTTDETEENEYEDWGLNYGTCNRNVPLSTVPCGGCGAHLHCQDSSIPGYIPSEIFVKCTDGDLRALVCQRCHFMQNYNAALSVTVDKDLYPTLLSKIKGEKALIILIVDLTDLPCSIWPGILDIIGYKRPIVLVGNKVDLLWGDSKGWMKHVADVLLSSLPSNANIKHVQLISAKTGFGVEELITNLHNVWLYKGDVYLIGCTNVGKSTLFNTLLQSDYCKVKATDLVQRATTSPWPGTTLNLLKFPILRPESWRLFLRNQRLGENRMFSLMEKQLKKEQLQALKKKPKTPPQLIGHIGKTFSDKPKPEQLTFDVANKKDLQSSVFQGMGLDPDDEQLVNSRWCYDTPGALHSDQVLDLLTTEEIMMTLPKTVIEPRTFLVKPGFTLFIGGLSRLDYVEGDCSVRCTVFSSKELPVTICWTNDAEDVYKELLGTKNMMVPCNNGNRLEKWPPLQCGRVTPLSGIDERTSCADFVLSSSGWISVTPPAQIICKFLPWTPLARGIHIRVPALLPFAVTLRGTKINKLPAYGSTKIFNYD